MKKTFLTLTLTLALITQGGYKAHATAVAASIFPLQIVEIAGDVIALYDQYKSTIDNALVTYKSTVLDAVGNSLIAAAQQAAADDIVRWANGGFQGTPSIISNPEGFIKNQGIEAVRAGLFELDKNSNNTLLKSITDAFRSTESLKMQLEALSHTSLASIIQKNVCNETNLNALAIKEATKNPDGSMNQASYNARKTEIYNGLCLGKPTADPALATKLTSFGQLNPNLVGMDSILAISAGENDYARGARAVALAKEAEAQAQARALQEKAEGQGVVSQKKCIKNVTNQSNGATTCAEYETVTPSGLVKGPAQTALTSGIDRLTNIQGDGVLSRLLTAFATGFLTRAMSGSVASPGNYNTTLTLTAAGPNGTAYTGPTNTSVTTGGTSPFVQNLANDPLTKADLIVPFESAFKVYEKELNDLEALDTPFLTKIDAHEIKVNELTACYDELAAIDPLWENKPEVVAGRDLVKSRQTTIEEKRADVNAELLGITAARAYVNEIRAKLQTSNSSAELASIFSTYRDQVVARKYPSSQNIGPRRGEILTAEGDVDKDLKADGPLGSKLAECQAFPRNATTAPPSQTGSQGN